MMAPAVRSKAVLSFYRRIGRLLVLWSRGANIARQREVTSRKNQADVTQIDVDGGPLRRALAKVAKTAVIRAERLQSSVRVKRISSLIVSTRIASSIVSTAPIAAF